MLAAIIDGVIILLLIGSISYGYMVSRKVRVLMATLKDLEPLVEEFSTAVDKSEHSVARMRENIAEAERQPAPEPQWAREVEEEETAFTSRRSAPQQEMPGRRVVRDKKDLVRAFFETSGAARV